MLVFIALPFIAFFLGIWYQTSISPKSTETSLVSTPKTSTSSATTDTTADWKTYKSDTNKFAFKYPSNAIFYEDKKNVVHIRYEEPNTEDGVEMKPGYSLRFSMGNSGPLTLKAYVEKYIDQFEKEKLGQITRPIAEVKINGNLGYRYSSVIELETTHIYIPYYDSQYTEILKNVSDPNQKGYETTVDRILSTFKFTDQSQADPTDD